MRWSFCTVGLVVAFAVVSPAAASSASERQCDAQDGECSTAPPPPAPGELASEPVLTEASLLADEERTSSTHRNSSNAEELRLENIGFWRIGIVLMILGGMVSWILCTIRFAIDGSLPARLAMWGFLPEAYAAISTRAVVHLLRLKKTSTPVIVLRSCVTDQGAQELADGIRKYPAAELEALELPHNPKLGQMGIRALVEMARESTSKLEELDLSYNPQLSSFIVPELLPLLPHKASNVTTLKLMDCGLNKAEVQKLATGLRVSSIKQLDLSLNPLEGAGEVLSAVCEAPVLEEIVLKYCGLSAEDVGVVAENLPFTSIKAVQLAGNRFGRPGLEALVEHLPNCQVDELGLETNELEAKDLSVLGEAWVKRPFSRVRLNGNRMTYEEISTFVSTLKSMQA